MQRLIVFHAKVALLDGVNRVLRNQLLVNVINVVALNCRFLNFVSFDLHLGNLVLIKF